MKWGGCLALFLVVCKIYFFTTMFRGTEKQVFKFPDVINDHVEKSKDFEKVRSSFWRTIHQLYSCFIDQDTFDKRDMNEMRQGKAPYCKESQVYEWRNKMEIHHKKWRKDFEDQAKANLIDNLEVLSPLYHMTAILTNIAHFGYFRGTKKNNEQEEKEKKRRKSIK